MNIKNTFSNKIWIILLFTVHTIGLCNADDVSDAILEISPYEYIVENAPKRLKLISQEILSRETTENIIDFYAPVSAKNELCRNQSLFYKQSFMDFDPWALRMWDSSGKLPSGILDGHFHDLGNYGECLEVPKSGPFHVKYCLIEIKNFFPQPGYAHHAKFNKIKAALFGSLKLIKERLYLARCVPATCNDEELENYYTSVVSKYNMSVEIDDHGCTASNENVPYTTLDWAVIVFLFLSVFLVIIATVVHSMTSDIENTGVFIKLLLCYSVYINSYQILTTKYLKTKLSFLSGLRGLSMILIILAHMTICLTSFPKINYMKIVKDYGKPKFIFAFISTFNLAVDVFLIISGLLISYLQMRNLQLGRKFNIKLYYIRRFFRIIPPYAAQIALYVTVLYRYVGSGPIWKVNMGITRDNCLKNWWTNLLFINNYVHQDEMCIPTNWYLAVDMQLYIIAPLILFPMIKSDVFRKYGIPSVIFIFNVWTSYISYVNNYEAGSMVEVNARTEDTNQYVYISTQCRVGSWLLGLYLGYILYKVDEEPKKKIISKVTLWVGWGLTILVQILAVLSLYYFMHERVHHILFDALYNGFHRTIYSASICWLIYACELGYGGYLYNFLTWYPLQVMGRLTFTAYLSQMLILMGIDSMTSVSLQYQPIMELRNAISNVAVCFIQSFFLCILIELPYANMGRVFAAGVNKDDGGIPKEEAETPELNGTAKDVVKEC